MDDARVLKTKQEALLAEKMRVRESLVQVKG